MQPVAIRVFAASDHRIDRVRAATPHIGREIAQCEAASAPPGRVRVGAMGKHVRVQGTLPGFQNVVRGLSHIPGPHDLLRKGRGYQSLFPFQVPALVGPRQEFHRAVFFVGIIDEVAIFNSILSEEDLQSIMEKGLVKTLGREAVLSSGRLTSRWAILEKFD